MLESAVQVVATNINPNLVIDSEVPHFGHYLPNVSGAGVHQDKLNATMKAIKDHLQSPTGESYQKLLHDLNYLETSGDPTVFDMSSMTGAQFHMNLYELLTRLDSTSALLWKAISLLQKACTQSKSHSTLSYRYIPLLGKVLAESLTQEKKLKLLSLLQVSHQIKTMIQ